MNRSPLGPVLDSEQPVHVSATRSSPRLFAAKAKVPLTFSIGSNALRGSGIDCFIVVIATTGTWRIRSPDAEFLLARNMVMIADVVRPTYWESESELDREIIILGFPRSRMLGIALDDDIIHCHVCDGPGWLTTGIRLNAEWLLQDQLLVGDEGEGAASEACATFILRLLKHSVTSPMREGKRATSTQLSRVVRFINTHLASPDLGPELLEASFGLSRAALYRSFEPLGGVSRYIRERRLASARSMLEDPTRGKESVSAIAKANGFKTPAAFSRAYRDRFGEAPLGTRIRTLQTKVRRCEEDALTHAFARLV